MIKFLKYLKNEKLNEISGVLLFSLGVLILISVISFNVNDPPASNSKDIHNFCGLIGAYFSHILFLIVGKGVYVVPVLIILMGVYEFKDKKIKESTLLKIIGVILITIGLSILFNNFGKINLKFDEPNIDIREKGGVIGLYCTVLLFPVVRYGIFLIVFMLIMLGIVFSTSLSFSDFLKHFLEYLNKFSNFSIKFLKKLTKSLFFGIKDLFIYLKNKSFKNSILIVDEEEYQRRLYKIENFSSEKTEPKINYYQSAAAADDSKNKESISEVPTNEEANAEEPKKKFFIFKRKKKEAVEPKINKEFVVEYNNVEKDLESETSLQNNSKDNLDIKVESDSGAVASEISKNGIEKNGQPVKSNVEQGDAIGQSTELLENNSSEIILTEPAENPVDSGEGLELNAAQSEISVDAETLKKLQEEQRKLDNEFRENLLKEEEEPDIVIPRYILPAMDLLKYGKLDLPGPSDESLQKVAKKINETLDAFKIEAFVREINPGPVVTMFEVVPSAGVPVQKIVAHYADLQLRLAAKSIRIIAPIPGKSAVGIEVPNEIANIVTLRDVLESAKLNRDEMSSILTFGLGKDVLGRPVNVNLTKMPHLLIAGATGSGKSVCINTIIVSFLMNANPEELKMILIDPKVVELSTYNKLPHLITPVVVDPKKAARAFQWAVDEMDERYMKCGEFGVRDIERYNQKVKKLLATGEYDKYKKEDRPALMPYVVIIVDELADLMMTARECEGAIARIAQKARAVGVHMILATQRPSVNVITGLIKANFPTRIAFQVASGVDSKTILDTVGAETLLGNGDMLYLSRTAPKPVRLQGCYLSDEEINSVIEFVSNQEASKFYKPKKAEEIFQIEESEEEGVVAADMDDPMIKEAEELIITSQRGSIAMLQQKLKIGHKRAQSLMMALEAKGVVGPQDGPQPRKVLISPEAYYGTAVR